jgi:hypothetical protein
MLIGKERARVRVSLQKFDLTDAGEFTFHQIDYRVFSYGATPALISESLIGVGVSRTRDDSENTVSRQPMSLPPVFHPDNNGLEKLTLILTQLTKSDVDDIRNGTLFVHCRGSIEYRDVFDRERKTCFKYTWKSWYSPILASWGGFWLKVGSAEDNCET